MIRSLAIAAIAFSATAQAIKLETQSRSKVRAASKELLLTGPGSVRDDHSTAALAKEGEEELSYRAVYSSVKPTTYQNYVSSKKNKESNPFVEFIFGLILICFALPMVWMNERRQVKFYSLIQKAGDNVVRNVDSAMVIEDNHFNLVHTKGMPTTENDIQDERFTISIDQTLKLRRVVEMYQWRELVKEEDDHQTYYYTKEWSSTLNASEAFSDPTHKNPSEFPCQGEEFINEVKLGQYVLQQEQIERLSGYQKYELPEDQIDGIVSSTSELMGEKGFQPLYHRETEPGVFRSRLVEIEGDAAETKEDQIGDIKIHWEYLPCAPITIMAQQMEDDKSQVSFRQWNPEKRDALWTEDNGSSTRTTCPIACICCFIIEKLFKVAFQETVDYIEFGEKEADEVLQELSDENECYTRMFRYMAWFMSIFGHYLLFSPIIAVFTWIPFVGALLATIAKAAAIVFALVWASFLHVSILATAWIAYRPLYGIILLSVCVLLLVLMNSNEVTGERAVHHSKSLAELFAS